MAPVQGLSKTVSSTSTCYVAKLPRGAKLFSAKASKTVLQSRQYCSVPRPRSVQAYAAAALAEEEDVEEALRLPAGYHWYETMIVFRTTLTDEERDKELAKFEAYLNKEECMHINALVRPKAKMAYPIKGNWEGVYVLYTYAAKRQTARQVQINLSKPESGAEDNILRHMTLCRM